MARIRIFNNISEPNRVDKSDYITQTLILDGSFRDSVSITHPVIDIKSKNIIDGNYIYIEEFNRYYFVRSIEIVRTGLYRMYCDVDVLMSFKTEIGNLKAVVKRNEFEFDSNIIDDYVPSLVGSDFEYHYSSANPFTPSEYYNGLYFIWGCAKNET